MPDFLTLECGSEPQRSCRPPWRIHPEGFILKDALQKAFAQCSHSYSDEFFGHFEILRGGIIAFKVEAEDVRFILKVFVAVFNQDRIA